MFTNILVAVSLPDELDAPVFFNHDCRRQRAPVVCSHLRHCIGTCVEHGDHLAGAHVARKHPVVGQPPLAVQIKVDIASITEWAGYSIGRIVGITRSRGIHRLVVPLVHDHREHEVISGIGQQPVLAGLGPVLEIADSSQNCAGICNHASTRLENDLELIEERLCSGLARRVPDDLDRCPEHFGR